MTGAPPATVVEDGGWAELGAGASDSAGLGRELSRGRQLHAMAPPEPGWAEVGERVLRQKHAAVSGTMWKGADKVRRKKRAVNCSQKVRN